MMLCIVRVAVRLLLGREADLAMGASPNPNPGSSGTDNDSGPLGMVDVMIDEYRSDGQVPTYPRCLSKHIHTRTNSHTQTL